jgi:hypothetical protein
MSSKFASIFVLAAWPVTAWGPAGHRIVALIAEQRLSPEVKAKIAKLLLDGKYSIADISSCADAIRSTNPRPEEQFCRDLAGTVPPTNGTWHYTDIPLPTKAKTLDAFCKDDNCATARIRLFSDILRTSTDDAQRRQALLFLVHFVGDIHQPLHAVERACDRGGNSERVNFVAGEQQHPNAALHSVWDGDEVTLLLKNSKVTDERAYAAALNAKINPGDAKKWARATSDQMAWESYKLAKKIVYRGIPFQDFCQKPPPTPIVTDLTLKYEQDGTKVVREQLMKAGARLAAMLEEDLGGR